MTIQTTKVYCFVLTKYIIVIEVGKELL